MYEHSKCGTVFHCCSILSDRSAVPTAKSAMYGGEAKVQSKKYTQKPHIKVWGCSSAGRAPALQAGGHGFDSHHLHHRQVAGPKLGKSSATY